MYSPRPSTFVTADGPVWTLHCHPASTVYVTVRPWRALFTVHSVGLDRL